MPLLTRQLLNLSYLRSSNPTVHEKGLALHRAGQTQVIEFSGSEIVCLVTENNKPYTVTITASSGLQIVAKCTCPADKPYFRCQHVVAAVAAAQDYLQNVAEKNWRYQLSLALEMSVPYNPPKSTRRSKAVFLVGLHLQKSGSFYQGFLQPRFIPGKQWDAVETIAASDQPVQTAAEVLGSRSDWIHFAQHYSVSSSLEFVNLSFEAKQIIKIILEKSSYYYAGFSFSHLPLIYELNIPIFLWEKDLKPRQLHVHKEPVTLQMALVEIGDEYELQPGLELNGEIYTVSTQRLKLITRELPIWALAGNTLVPIANENVLNLLPFFPLRIPIAEGEEFRQHYFAPLNARTPLVGEPVKWEIIRAKPVPRLYLSKEGNEPLLAELRFGYGDHEVRGSLRPPDEELITSPGSWGGVKILRDVEAERAYYDLLTDATYGLKRAGPDRPGFFRIRVRTHPLDFLTKCIPALTAAGFEIYGEKNIAKLNPHRPTLSLNISSGIDWFDVQAMVRYGEQEVSLGEIRKILKRGERYVKLADGSIGQIPEEWLERYKHLFALAEETVNGLRVNNLQLTLLDELLAEAETKNIAPEFHAQRERLRSFERIVEQPLPQGFAGELRPYQKAGYDWLYFLHDYGFGGILADDMGLGKTVQALVFLQSLKERGLLPRPALLVVPKSLLVNWQREAARFTPDLRLLEFMGSARERDPELFAQYDIVITTYGTMLRDIEFLRGYRFCYVILDESQAIKNPLAQSSKAARLLQADHRLCLTGTPVENNAYELWSQFAFLNPGMLGSLDYFKSEFASAIERRDEASQPAVEVLRRLTYPFILRRTKEQVAPELPPRSERTIFTDLVPAQRKLYQQTRDYYRGVLLGLLEDRTDINDIRFKILEGLLRLRQVCIHPRLVDPAYRGDSAKFEVLLETLETLQAEGHKALVFSQFVQTLTLLRQEMDARGLAYAYLDGQTQNRQEQVDRFQNDPRTPFFLISLKAGGFGLNLTAADYVLHIDPWWNPAVEMQASDRAHRIGQDKPVFIYKFIARNTVEEKILELQARKRELVEQLIAADGSVFKSLTKQDVKMLFS